MQFRKFVLLFQDMLCRVLTRHTTRNIGIPTDFNTLRKLLFKKKCNLVKFASIRPGLPYITRLLTGTGTYSITIRVTSRLNGTRRNATQHGSPTHSFSFRFTTGVLTVVCEYRSVCIHYSWMCHLSVHDRRDNGPV